MRKIALFLVITLLFASMFYMQVFAAKEFSIVLNGQKAELAAAHTFKAGRTMVPLDCGLFEKFGAVVRYDETAGKAWIEGGYSTVELTLNESVAYIHRKYDFTGIPMKVEMDVAPFAENGKVYIPLRFVAEGLDVIVDWDGINNSVILSTAGDIIPVETPAVYEEINLQDIPEELTDWVEENRKAQGIYFKSTEDKTFILISAGEQPTGGYFLQLNSATVVAPGSIYLSAQVIPPAQDMMVTQALTWPCMLIAIEGSDIHTVDGIIENATGELSEKINFEIVDAQAIADNRELSDWVQKQQGIDNIAYTRIGDELFVYVGVGEKPTGGYTVEVIEVAHNRPDEAFVNAVLHSPAPDMMVIQVITTPFTVIRFKQGTIKHVGGEVKNAAAVETITSVGANIKAEDISDITLKNLEGETVKNYSPDEFTQIAGSFNSAAIDDSFYILMITGNQMTITLKDGTTINMTSYGSQTNIVAAKSSPDGSSQSWHLVCPEIAGILAGKE